jgi:hypothetical protein
VDKASASAFIRIWSPGWLILVGTHGDGFRGGWRLKAGLNCYLATFGIRNSIRCMQIVPQTQFDNVLLEFSIFPFVLNKDGKYGMRRHLRIMSVVQNFAHEKLFSNTDFHFAVQIDYFSA